MRAKTGVLILSVFLMSLLFIVSAAYASLAPMLAVDEFFGAVNSNEVENAIELFAPEATVINNLTGRTYEGEEAIGELLDVWMADNRSHDIVSSVTDGDMVYFTVEVSDRGLVWAQERMSAKISGDLIQELEVHDIRLVYWPMISK